MSNLKNLQLSQLVDNELAKSESAEILEQVLEQPELATKLRHYQWIGGVIKSEEIFHTEANFVSKVSQHIKQEAAVAMPAWRRQKSNRQTLLAIAASVAIIAVIGFGGMQLLPKTLQPSITIADNTDNVTQTGLPVIFKAAQQVVTVAGADNEVSTKAAPRFIEYLKAHDNSLYATGSSGFQSYVRVVNLDQK